MKTIIRGFVALFFALPIYAHANTWHQTLRDTDLTFGVAVEPHYLADPLYVEQLLLHFNAITPENTGKWVHIHPKRKQYDFSGMDTVVDFAQKHDLVVRGHALVWHHQNPGWLTNGMWLEHEAREELFKHIDAVVSRYKGKILRWDVVNEALADNGEMRGTQWFYLLGENYLADAFHRAHANDPEALLYYNDYGISDCGDKANAAYQLMRRLLNADVPVHGIGFQGHYEVKNPVDLHCLNDNINRMGELGLEVQITELDIRLEMANLDDDLAAKQADQYRQLMGLLATNEYLNGITVWGLSDAHSWVPSWFQGQGSALLFDESLVPKPAMADVQSSLTNYLENTDAFQLPARRELTLRSFPTFGAQEWSALPEDLNQAWQTVPTYPMAFNQLNPLRMAVNDTSDIFGAWQIAYHGTTLMGRVHRQDDITAAKNSAAIWENDCVEVFVKWEGKLYQFRSQVGEDFVDIGFPGSARASWNEDGTVMDFELTFDGITELKGETVAWNIALADVDTAGGSRESQLYPVPGANKSWVGKDLAELHFEGQNRPPSQQAKGVVAPVNAVLSAGGELPENTRRVPAVPVSFMVESSDQAFAYPTVMLTWDEEALTAHATAPEGYRILQSDLQLQSPAKTYRNQGAERVQVSMDAPLGSNLFYRASFQIRLANAQGVEQVFTMAPDNGFFDVRTQ